MPLLGAHMSIAGHPHKALLRGKESGCQVIQVFTRHRLKWSAKGLSGEEIASFKRTKNETSILPVSIHGSYLINPASSNAEGRLNSCTLILDELEWADQLGIPYLVIHPGSHMGAGERKGIERAAKTIGRALKRSSGYKAVILLETTAGQGTSLGYRFEHLAGIMELNEFSERLGVCFDTCHAYASGYDFRNEEAYRQIMEEFDRLIGVNRLKMFHVNDSKKGAGAKIDRHEHPGKGLIGLKPFSFFLNDPLFLEHPFLLETPKGKDKRGRDYDTVNMKKLRRLIK